MVIFNSYVSHYQRVTHMIWDDDKLLTMINFNKWFMTLGIALFRSISDDVKSRPVMVGEWDSLRHWVYHIKDGKDEESSQ